MCKQKCKQQGQVFILDRFDLRALPTPPFLQKTTGNKVLINKGGQPWFYAFLAVIQKLFSLKDSSASWITPILNNKPQLYKGLVNLPILLFIFRTRTIWSYLDFGVKEIVLIMASLKKSYEWRVNSDEWLKDGDE